MENTENETVASTNNKNIFFILGGLVVLGAFGFLAYSTMSKSSTPAAVNQTVTPTQATAQEPTEEVKITTPSATAIKETKVFQVTNAGFSFNPKEIKVKKGDTVKIVFTSKGGTHNWVLDEFDAETKQLQTGETGEVTFVADKAGTFEYYCSVGNHRQMGMVGNLIVEE